MADIQVRKKYIAEPTARLFHRSPAFVRGIMGPIGSGKSVACIMELQRLMRDQLIGPDGKRRTRIAVIRNSYPELKSTTIKTFREWFPDEICRMKWDTPITAHVRFGDVESEVIFLALDQPKDIAKLLSLELTHAFINETREINFQVVRAVISRLRRFPSKVAGGFNRSCLLMDTNPPSDDSWWYKHAEVPEHALAKWEFFKQPGAVIFNDATGLYEPNPLAENIRNHTVGYDYYMDQIPGAPEEFIKVMLMGQYGSMNDGKPIYTDYRDAIHCPGVVPVIPGLPITLGFDYGRSPACAFFQMTPNGQVRWFDELLVDADGAGNGMGIRTFMAEVVMPYIANNYSDYLINAWGDPSGASPGDEEYSCMDIQAEEGMTVLPAPGSNDPHARKDSMSRHMRTLIDGKPGFAISSKCVVARKGLNGGYRLKRLQVSGDAQYSAKPVKDRFSHICEAGEYGTLGMNINIGIEPVKAKTVVKRSAGGWT